MRSWHRRGGTLNAPEDKKNLLKSKNNVLFGSCKSRPYRLICRKKHRLSYAMCKRYFSSEVVVNAGVNLNNLL